MKEISVAEARKNLAHVINEVAYGGERYTIRRRGKPLATLIGAAHYQALIGLLAEAGAASEIHGIPVHIHFADDRFSISDERFHLQGTGRTLEAARSDYWRAVQEHYSRLQTDAHQLAPYVAADQLARLERIIAAAQDEAG
jgi:prevent-host-death family protein